MTEQMSFQETGSEPPNVILIMCDQLRFDCLGCTGHDFVRTPNLDRLAERGVIFENAYCSSPVCSPARASWLTGLYPHAHGQLINYSATKPERFRSPDATKKTGQPWSAMRTECITLGDAFKGAGYRCGIVGPWHLGNDHRPQHGFEEFWQAYRYQGAEHADLLFDYFDDVGVPNLYDRKNPKYKVGAAKMAYCVYHDPRQQRTTWTVDRGLDFLGSSDGDGRPFFLFLSVKDPHPIMVAPPALVASYAQADIALPASWKDPLHGKPSYQENDHGRIPPQTTEGEIREIMAHYYGLVTHIDDQLGRLFDRLEALGIKDNTIVAFISDHGEMLAEHGFFGKRLLYEGSVKVPYLLSWPNAIPASQRIQCPVGGVDLAPTLLDLAGVAAIPRIHGRSVAGAVTSGQEPVAAPVFAEIASSAAIQQVAKDPDEVAAYLMIRDGQWKYIRNRYYEDELYNLDEDPGEMRNLARQSTSRDRVATLRAAIKAMLEQHGPAGPYSWCID